MIERHWKGLARRDHATGYIHHLRSDTFKALEKIPGFISADILHRESGEGIEFLIVTRWENFDAIVKFAGSGYSMAVVPSNVQQMMLRYDLEVSHYEVD